ncbi:UNKNOWN [Stylonychia lemnae]|uniref:Uncharacterized protein n=1 Tax=Stylonychia lemnae TaxID=5949 RepID=A0A078A0Y6_STYLE|nr:UNKNOWN [Stylonychia lemnae]|eukprot:CDW74449.1 UNKNOWN [Stylonychia lemnae]
MTQDFRADHHNEIKAIMDAQKQREKQSIFARLFEKSVKSQEKQRQRNLQQNYCDPLYKRLIQDMVEEHLNYKGEFKSTALVFCDSSQQETKEMEDYLTQKDVLAEMFEINRMLPREMSEYMNCISEMYQVKELPVIIYQGAKVDSFETLKNLV